MFGDSRNDLSMMPAFEHSVAMTNASSIIKEAARYQTRSNTEDGIAAVLERLIMRYEEKRVSNF